MTASSKLSAILGRIVRFDPALDAIAPAGTRVEKLVGGFTWSEGPAWITPGDYLLFTDVPENTLYRWSQRDGLAVFLKPSGYAGPALDTLREPGANGLYPDDGGAVLLADSGTRVVARLDLASKRKTPIATHFRGLRFNSPNDVIRRSDGAIFFTDPPYGLKGLNDSPAKELRFNGVYRIDIDGAVHLLEDQLSFPNGIAFSPDQRTLYVSNSDPQRPVVMAYTLDARGKMIDRRRFADVADLVSRDSPGLPDGMTVSADGHLLATGPGGVLIFSPDGRRLGRIETGTQVANCTFGDDGCSLYMASHDFLARTRLSVRGCGFPR